MNLLNKIFGQKKEIINPGKRKLPDAYLFRSHSQSIVVRWSNELKYGFYKRAWGGHANDGDEFGIWLNYVSKDELFQILNALNISLKKIPENYPRPLVGKNYSYEEFQKFKNEIKDFPEYEQPSHISISSVPCFCWIENGKLCFSFSGAEDGNRYEVTETDFNNCLAVERAIKKAKLETYVSREYENWVTHISVKYYPELFE